MNNEPTNVDDFPEDEQPAYDASDAIADDEDLSENEENFEDTLSNTSSQTIRGLVTSPRPAQSSRAAVAYRPRVTLQTLATVIFAAVLVATLLTLWMPSAFTGDNLQEQYVAEISVPQITQQAEEGLEVSLPQEFPENKIGIIIGHKGRDEGEVCSNGLTEVEINSTVATYLQQKLIELGYDAELLDETDPRLVGYQAQLLIALHCNSCEYINDNATGFKFAIVPSEVKTIDRELLTKCLSEAYANATGLKYHYQTTTNEIRNYHAFDQIDPLTAAMIFELGYMNLDQDILTNRPEVLAEGLANGIQCYMNAD
ncbi:MAG TPA: N-acetylmuramoyl-L-alanine amidase [Anaerolineaceae bacterium]|nr:N-acetylmuramoyl-L-alanine amidase [Anaerolineaceae bacterium]